ncbi:MAG: hypothetical protein HQM15_00375 [Deltaproteobacteria bacterium]|nr:hypothetical protein [Deltaproteobacteria bacterium]
MGKVINKNILSQIVKEFGNKKVLVIGDSILDIYVYGHAIGKSAETPTIVAREEKTECSFGGASCVVTNLLELGAQVTFVSVIGEDLAGKYYDEWSHPKLNFHKIKIANKCTTVKKRFWVDGYKLLQFDQIDNTEIESQVEKEIIAYIEKNISSFDLLLLVDYRHGMISNFLAKSINDLSFKFKVPVFASSQVSQRESNHLNYAGSDYICLNLKEANQVLQNFNPQQDLTKLSALLNSSICLTLGNQGAFLKEKNRETFFVSSIKVEEVDPCSAGDSFLASFSLSNPLSYPEESLFLANCWAGLSVTKKGTKPPLKSELNEYISNLK